MLLIIPGKYVVGEDVDEDLIHQKDLVQVINNKNSDYEKFGVVEEGLDNIGERVIVNFGKYKKEFCDQDLKIILPNKASFIDCDGERKRSETIGKDHLGNLLFYNGPKMIKIIDELSLCYGLMGFAHKKLHPCKIIAFLLLKKGMHRNTFHWNQIEALPNWNARDAYKIGQQSLEERKRSRNN